MKRITLCLIALLLLSSGRSFAQNDTSKYVIIDKIILHGNRVTKPGIILREMKFSAGDTIPGSEFPALLEQSRKNVFNTNLFNVVSIDAPGVLDMPGAVSVEVWMVERWYIIPIPYLEFPNRNLNAWLETTHWDRLTYGLNIAFNNARGRNETFTAVLHFGYNQRYGFTYRTPYINRKQTWGFGFGGEYGLNRALQVGTHNNKGVYMDTTGASLQHSVYAFTELFFRPGLYTYHTLRLAYNYFDFADTLLSVPGFLTSGDPFSSLFSLYYRFKYDRRDIRYYPLKGFYWDVELQQTGFDAAGDHVFSARSTVKKYFRLGKRWFWASLLSGRISFPGIQPYYLMTGLGQGRDFVRGYEYYIIYGQHFLLEKNNLKFALIPQRIARLEFIDNTRFSVVPYGLYLNLFADFGYVYTPDAQVKENNFLQNRFLAGFGMGADFTTYYDVVLGLDFSMNSRWEPGVYVHLIAPI